MPIPINLKINTKNNHLTYLGKFEYRIRKEQFKERFILCKCDCGKTIYIRQTSFISGHTKSCGCIKKEINQMNIKKSTERRIRNRPYFKILFPKLAREYSIKNSISIFELKFIKNNKQFIWNCPKNKNHEYKASLKARIGRKSVKGTNCPYCDGKLVNKTNSFGDNFPQLLQEWDYTKNNIDPHKIHFGTREKYFWICKNNSNHTWKSQLHTRTHLHTGCPYCNSLANSNWLKWEKWCQNIAKEIYKKNLLLQPLTRLPNNKIPDLMVRTNDFLLIIDAKTNPWINSINEDIKHYSPYCDKLEFWCLYRKRESITIEILERKIIIDFLSPENILNMLLNNKLKAKFTVQYKKILNDYLHKTSFPEKHENKLLSYLGNSDEKKN